MKKSLLLVILLSMAVTVSACNGSGVTDILVSMEPTETIGEHIQKEQVKQLDTAMLVNPRGDTTTVYKLADGRYMDRTNTVYIFNGVDTWTDESGAEWNETTQPSEAEESVQDPYDLYSWDSETGTYIPYQQAEGNGEPIGRGNGWYYYDEEAEAYIPW